MARTASSQLLRLRFDGVEVLVLALLFAGVVGSLWTAFPHLSIRAIACLGVGSGLVGVAALRLVRSSRAQPADTPGAAVVGGRSLAALLLLGVGWFVVVLAVGGIVLVASFLSDVKEADRTAILIPMVPLAVGAGLVALGLRIKRVPTKAS